jgi:hypothetical protein
VLSRLPWSPRPETKQRQKKLRRDQRDQLVNAMAEILQRGEESPFRYEAYCRHGLRSGLVLAGWSWALSDATAQAIVASALNRIGAKRPPWIEGQRGYAQSGTLILCANCHQCGKVLLTDLHLKYCSADCRDRFHHGIAKKWLGDADTYKWATRTTRGLDDAHNAA